MEDGAHEGSVSDDNGIHIVIMGCKIAHDASCDGADAFPSRRPCRPGAELCCGCGRVEVVESCAFPRARVAFTEVVAIVDLRIAPFEYQVRCMTCSFEIGDEGAMEGDLPESRSRCACLLDPELGQRDITMAGEVASTVRHALGVPEE